MAEISPFLFLFAFIGLDVLTLKFGADSRRLERCEPSRPSLSNPRSALPIRIAQHREAGTLVLDGPAVPKDKLPISIILRNEGLEEARFWIINAPENLASARGIEKAGFRVVGDLAFAQDDGRAGLVPATDHDRAAIGAGLLGVPLIQATASAGVSPCWCCIIAALREGGQAACWPTGTLEAAPCSCGRTRNPGGTASDSAVSLSEEALAHL